MYQDYKGFVHADKNVHSNGSGYDSLEDFVKSKINKIEYSKFIGININFTESKQFIVYFIVKDFEGRIVKYELKDIDEKIFIEAFHQISLMIYDNGVQPIKKLEESNILGQISLIN